MPRLSEPSNILWIGIKRTLEKAKVNYSCVSIVQEPDLKERLEELELKRYKVTIASVGAIKTSKKSRGQPTSPVHPVNIDD